MNFSLYHQIPLWLDYAIFLAVLLTSLELGYRIGLRRKEAWTEIEEAGDRHSGFRSVYHRVHPSKSRQH